MKHNKSPISYHHNTEENIKLYFKATAVKRKIFQYVDDIIAAREQANDKLREELVRYLIQDTIFFAKSCHSN